MNRTGESLYDVEVGPPLDAESGIEGARAIGRDTNDIGRAGRKEGGDDDDEAGA